LDLTLSVFSKGGQKPYCILSYETKLKMFEKDKHSSLFERDEEKSFITSP